MHAGGSITRGAYPLEGPTKNDTTKAESMCWPDWTMHILSHHLSSELRERLVKVNGALSATTSHCEKQQ